MLSIASVLCLLCGVASVRAFGGEGDGAPEFLQEVTREDPFLVEAHHLRKFARGDFGKGKKQALVSLITTEGVHGGAGPQEFMDTVIWEIKGLASDGKLRDTVIGVFDCLREEFASLCALVFGDDINKQRAQFYFVPPAGQGKLRKFTGSQEEATQAKLTAFIRNSDACLLYTSPSPRDRG